MLFQRKKDVFWLSIKKMPVQKKKDVVLGFHTPFARKRFVSLKQKSVRSFVQSVGRLPDHAPVVVRSSSLLATTICVVIR